MKTIIKIDSIIDAKDKVECWKGSIWFLQILERSAFYVGITNDLERRLKEHNVDLDGHLYIVYDCGTDEVAKAAETALGALGYDTGKRSGNGGDDSRYLYVYMKIPYGPARTWEDR